MLYIDTIDNAVSMHTVFTNLTGFLNHTRYISYVFLILLVAIGCSISNRFSVLKNQINIKDPVKLLKCSAP